MDRYLVEIEPNLRSIGSVDAGGDRESILMVSIPKSGTVYLHELIVAGLGLKPITVSNGYFPEDQLRVEELEEFKRGDRIASVHIDPSPVNLQLLDWYVRRWVVHIRDPRSVMLSWTHHTEQLFQGGSNHLLLKATPVPPPAYHAMSLVERIDWQMDHFLPSVVAWTKDWVRLADRYSDRILLTEFSELKNNEQELMNRIARHCGHASGDYRHAAPDKTMAVHFRRGELDEWRRVFTIEQRRRAEQLIPLEYRVRFGWN